MEDSPEHEKDYRVDSRALKTFVEKIVEETRGVGIRRTLFGKEVKVKEYPEGIDVSLGLVVSRGEEVPNIVREFRERLSGELQHTFSTPLRQVHITIRKIAGNPST